MRRKEKAPYKIEPGQQLVLTRFRTALGRFSVLTDPALLGRLEIVSHNYLFRNEFCLSNHFIEFILIFLMGSQVPHMHNEIPYLSNHPGIYHHVQGSSEASIKSVQLLD